MYTKNYFQKKKKILFKKNTLKDFKTHRKTNF